MNEYINQFRQVSSDKEAEVVNSLIGKKNVLEVGYYAGQVSVRLAEVVETLVCIDLPNKFFSPDLADHIKLNHISNIRSEIVEDVIQYVKDNYSNFDAIYIDESHGRIDGLITWLEKNTHAPFQFLYNNHATDSIKSINIVVSKEVKRAVAEAAVAAEQAAAEDKKVVSSTPPKKRTTKQSKTTTK